MERDPKGLNDSKVVAYAKTHAAPHLVEDEETYCGVVLFEKWEKHLQLVEVTPGEDAPSSVTCEHCRRVVEMTKTRVESLMKTNAIKAAIKHDTEKPRMDLLSEVAIEGLARVLTFGAKKYAADNWRKGMEWRRLIGAAMRHLFAYSRGEDLDPESGLPHIDHLACCVMFLSEYQKRKLGTDDRYKATKEPLEPLEPLEAVELRDAVSRMAERYNISFTLNRIDGWRWVQNGQDYGPFGTLGEAVKHAEANHR